MNCDDWMNRVAVRTDLKQCKSDGLSFLVRFQEMEDMEDSNRLLLALLERVS